MKSTNRSQAIWILALIAFAAGALHVSAYEAWQGDGDDCVTCHGSFLANPYVSLSDGEVWSSSLHLVHRGDMLNGDCEVCHSQGGRTPVILNSSVGGTDMDPISCVGCHGRSEDQGLGSDRGAGLRQHHFNAGQTVCTNCHNDADPSAYTPVGEGVLPPYYANPGTGHPAIPTSPCNEDGSENFEGTTVGLDNDGDLVYDTADLDCACLTDSLAFSIGSKSNFAWQPPANDACPLLYDVAKGTLSDLRSTGAFGGASCLENNDIDLQASDSATPSSSDGFYYISRVDGDSWDTGTEATPRDSSLTVCDTP